MFHLEANQYLYYRSMKQLTRTYHFELRLFSYFLRTDRKRKHERNLFERGNLHETIASKW